MRKGDISIQYIFLIFIGVIAVFVIVGMLTKWSMGTDKFMCVLTGDCTPKDGIIDKKTIWVRDIANPDKFKTEIAKQAKICFESMRKNGGEQGELCYTVKCCENDDCNPPSTTCSSTCAEVVPIIEASLGPNNVICYNFGYKAIIEYDIRESKVKIN